MFDSNLEEPLLNKRELGPLSEADHADLDAMGVYLDDEGTLTSVQNGKPALMNLDG